mgnify:CR=1 FL=1
MGLFWGRLAYQKGVYRLKSVLLIGLGNFGQALGERLKNMGDEVMIVDRNEDLINSLSSKYTGAAIANCMNADNKTPAENYLFLLVNLMIASVSPNTSIWSPSSKT